MKKIALLTLIISFFAFLPVKAQLLIKGDGRIIVGPDNRPEDDFYQILSMSIQGKIGEYNAGAKLGFGDFGRYENNGWNVFIGEYGTYDSDILWLHGKNGFKITAFNSSYPVCEWYYNERSLPRLTIHDGVRADRITVSSDDLHKSSISNILYALPRLMMLDGIIYNYQSIENYDYGDYENRTRCSANTSLKARADQNRAISIIQARGCDDIRYGLMTSQLINLFPEIVDYDPHGNQYVNYLELIPVLISALKEMYNALEYNGITFDIMNDYENFIQNMQSDSLSGAQSNNLRRLSTLSPNPPQAILYQNSPNPFTNATTIEYYIPMDATEATLFIFNLTGELLQTHPISVFGKGQITICGSTLNAGMYIYSLVVNEQVADTKRMILTK